VAWANGKLDAVRGSGRYIDRPPFAPPYEAVLKLNAERTPKAVARAAS
jgi:dihydropyrimidinase